MRTIPFTIIEEVFASGEDPAAPYSVQIEAELAGHLDERRLRAAVQAAVSAHPLARARRAPLRAGDRSYSWEVGDGLNLDPTSVLGPASEAAKQEARESLQGGQIPLDSSPLFRVLLTRGRGHDRLSLAVSHAVADGVGALRLLRSIARAYSGHDDPPAADEALSLRTLTRFTDWSLGPARLARLVALQRMQWSLWLEPPARVAPDGGDGGAGYILVHECFDGVSRRPPGRGAVSGPTVNDLLLAALALTVAGWNKGHGVDTRSVALMMPVNLRPPRWRADLFANASLSAVVFADVRAGDPPDLVARLAAQTARIKADPAAACFVDLYRLSGALPFGLRRAFPLPAVFMALGGSRFVPTSVVSNLGRLEQPMTFGDAPATHVWFSPPCRAPMDVSIGAVSVGGRLCLTFRARRARFGRAAVARLASMFTERLARLI